MPMLSQILIRLSILALCFTATPASAEWFAVEKIPAAFTSLLLTLIKDNWFIILIAFSLLATYLTVKNK